MKALSLRLEGTLVDLFVIVLVVIMTVVIAVVATDVLLVVVSMIHIFALVVAIVVPVTLIRKVANLVFVALHQFVAEFAFGTKLDLLLMLLREQTVSHLRVKNILEVLGNGLKFFVAEALSTLEVPCTVLLVEQHIEPLNFECVVGRGHAPHRKGFGLLKHLFEPAKMIEWRCHHQLLEDMVSARLKVDVLHIPTSSFSLSVHWRKS